ncbi:MAG: beta-ribofuranosylaminobenzene 5'-phosphate synthase [Methanobrevibacter boviskoreani]|jgi:beta-ribofuranosylaminobenzene 5'-phosphate synthase|uniref:beta-ribofuranosylaminobenzene 5'-phosphate synthase n=1 Tax=Methanobrevibacter boviskoreani TaxID=1348249 RepID=UPI003D8BF5FA
MIIKTPSRLHMCLIDMSGAYGRIDGGIGLTIDQPNFIIKGEESDTKDIKVDFCEDIDEEIKPECKEKIVTSADRIRKYYGIDEGFNFEVEKACLPHSGLGSGTQTALATGKLITEMKGIHENSVQLASVVGRGGTSGIGTFSFDYGGFIVDGGHSLKEKGSFLPSSASNVRPPQLLGHYDFPEDWDILVTIPTNTEHINGKKEVNIFQANCPINKSEVEQMSHIIFMNLIPFMLEHNIYEFGSCIDQIQCRGFKKVEVSLQPPKFLNLMKYMRDNGAYGVGMSSFGPAIYTIFDKENKDIVKATADYLNEEEGDTYFVCKAQNFGHQIIEK